MAVGSTAIFPATVKVKTVGAIGAGLPVLAVTVTLKALYRVVAGTDTVMVRIVPLPFSVGITLVGVKEQVVPVGRLEKSHERVTFEAMPAVRVAIIVVDPGFPGVSFTPPELESV